MVEILEEIGSFFREAREEIGLSLEQVSRDLKIRKTYISDLESGNLYKTLDREVYVSGIIKAYSIYLQKNSGSLEIDIDEVLEKYKEGAGYSDNEAIDFPRSNNSNMKPKIAIAAASLALILSAYMYIDNQSAVNQFINKQIESISDQYATNISDENATKNIEISNNEPIDNKVAIESDQKLEELSENENNNESNDKTANYDNKTEDNIDISKQDQESEMLNMDEYIDILKEKANNKLDQDGSAVSSVIEDNSEPEMLISESDDSAKSLNQNIDIKPSMESAKDETPNVPKIILMAREDTWVKVTDSDGNFIVEKVMKSGDTYFLPERNDLVISAGNANAIEVFVDGEEHSFLGTLNDVSNN